MIDCVVADLGGTFLRCALARGAELTALERIRLPGTAASRPATIWAEIVDAIARYADRHAAQLDASTPIGFAFPGPIVDGIVTGAPTVRGGGAPVPDIRTMLAERTGRTIGIVNDVSAAAWYFAERVSVDRFIVVTISSGIGAKVFDRRHAGGVLDDTPFAGEIGHLIVDPSPGASVCDCGGSGHLGALASARGLERSARAQAQRDAAGFARSAIALRFGATPATLTNELHLVPALRAADPWAMQVLRASIDPLAAVLRTLCVGGGIDAVILMGGFVQALGEPYRALVAHAVGRLSDCGPARTGDTARVSLAAADEEPSLLGAASFMRRLQPIA